MEVFYWILSLVWLAGWISQLASIHRSMKFFKVDYPYKGVKYAMPIVIFFTWPYFYFYGK